MQTSKQIYTKTQVVRIEDIDALQHVNNVVYVQWIQDVANEHWSYLTEKYSEFKEVLWVVRRHEIEYLGQAKLNDQVTISTWIGTSNKARSIRHVEIFNNNQLIVKAQTTWCMLTAKTFTFSRIPESILKLLEAAK